MNATRRRPRVAQQPARPAYTVLQWRQRWELRDGDWYREAAVRRADGELRLFLIRDDLVEAVA